MIHLTLASFLRQCVRLLSRTLDPVGPGSAPGAVLLAMVLSVLPVVPHALAQNAPPAREKIAVMDMRGVGANDAEREAISDRMREVLLKTGRFTVVDRSQMEAILTEQALQQTTCTEEQCAVEVGKILGVRKIVAGKIVKFGPDRWQVSAMLLDVETAVTVRADSIRFQGDIFGLLDTQVPLLGHRLTQETTPAVAAVGAVPPAPRPMASAPVGPVGPELRAVHGAWTDGPPLLTGRARHGAVPLPGHVLVVGGEGERGDPLDSVERLDVAAGKWQAVSPLPGPRIGPAVAALNGQVIAAGGRAERKVLERVDFYDPAADRWTPGPTLPSPREGALALVSGGRLYLVGGLDADKRPLDEVLVLEPGASQWRALPPLSQARGYASGATANGQLVVIGGSRGGGGLGSLLSSVMVKASEVYDPAADKWATLPDLPKALMDMSSARIGEEVYVFGGRSGSFAVMSTRGRYETFHLERKTWGEGGRMPTGRIEHATVVLPDRVLLIGGKPNQFRSVSELR